MVFGGSPNPAGFSCFLEMAMSDYHPSMGCSSETVRQNHLIPKEMGDSTTPVARAIRPAFLMVSTKLTSYQDCFVVDDISDCHLGTPGNM